MKKIVYTRPDGGTSVVTPSLGNRFCLRIISAFGIVLFASTEPIRAENLSRYWFLIGTAVWAETEDEFLARVQAKSVPPDATNISIVDESQIPQDRSFRDALKHDLTFDINKAQDITKDRLRREREPLFAANDARLQNALVDGSDIEKSEAIAERDRLRDVPTLADGITDLDVLKSLKAT